MKKKFFSGQAGFTLIELLIVITIISIMFGLSISSAISSQKSFIFTTAYEQIKSLMRQARSLAISGKTQLDYTDYDQDTFTDTNLNNGQPDAVTPAHYGIHFDQADGKITLFADIHTQSGNQSPPSEGVYDAPGANTKIGEYEPDKDIKLAEIQLDQNLIIMIPQNSQTVFYSPIFADATFNPQLTQPYLIFGVREKNVQNGRMRCSIIHPIAGIPEEIEKVDSALCSK